MSPWEQRMARLQAELHAETAKARAAQGQLTASPRTLRRREQRARALQRELAGQPRLESRT